MSNEICTRLPRISAIIPTHNGVRSVINTLQSICHQTLPPREYEILVVDNASSDNTGHAVEDFIRSQRCEASIRVIRENRLGLHFARNTGVIEARSEILAFTDDDIVVSSMWLEELLCAFDGPDIAAVGSKIKPKWTADPPDWIRHYATGYLSLLDWGDDQIELDWPGIWGGNMAIRREIVLEVGGFHPEAFGTRWVGDGETGLLDDVLRASYKLIYTPNAEVWHVIPTERLTLSYMRRRFANQAACDEYSFHRRFHLPRYKLLARFISNMRRSAQHKLLSVINTSEPTVRPHEDKLKAGYYLSAAVYCLRIAFDAPFREMVLKSDWISPASREATSSGNRSG